ncbi:glycosyltransferase family 4 protein [Planctomycetota bacterium]
MKQDLHAAFHESSRPDLALITNHGYAGVDIPFGGAPDTGGQNMYVNALARAFDALGYRVTVFARGGFPFFESERVRKDPEYLTEHVRYIFVPGGGESFIRKEDIAVALDEQVEWLDAFVRAEAAERGCRPWEVYELWNTHYWDAAVMGMQLTERWRDDVVADAFTTLLTGTIPQEQLERVRRERHGRALGEAPAYHLGMELRESFGTLATSLVERARLAAAKWVEVFRPEGDTTVDHLAGDVAETLDAKEEKVPKALWLMVAAQALGDALLKASGKVGEQLDRDLRAADRHVWTPHSLGALKEDNFRDKPSEVVRPLKFCERRNHERAVCDRTLAFAATSVEIGERLRTSYRVPQERIFYFPPCVDRSVFRKHKDEEVESTYRYLAEVSGVPAEDLKAGRIVFETSRMDQTKRKDLLLDAFRQVATTCPDAFLFIGGGPEKELHGALTARRDEHPELRGRAFLTGFIPDEHIGPLFSVADVYASASEMEGFGMSVLQATAADTAVVCSDLIPFAIQYVADTAIIVPAGDADGFARAIAGLLQNDADRTRRAQLLSEKAKEFDWEVRAADFLDYVRRCGFKVKPASV